MAVYKSDFPFGTGGSISGELFTDANPLVRPGKESVDSFYTMFKYHINDNWLTNVGFRYDKKDRLTLSDQENLSPRLGLVYSNEPEFQFKISYSESFVDSPYWNRYGALPSFRGSETLEPERLNSLQLTPSWHFWDGLLSYEVNFFYNHLTDSVFRNNLAGPDEPINTNAGNIESWGHEHQLIYQGKRWQARLVSFFNNVISSDDFLSTDDDIFNIPNETLNLIFDYRWSDDFHSSLQLNYFGKRLSPISINLNGEPITDPFPHEGAVYQAPDNELDAKVITNLSLVYEGLFGGQSSIELHAYNLFDIDYKQGGSTLHPYQQEGRWLQAQIRYRF